MYPDEIISILCKDANVIAVHRETGVISTTTGCLSPVTRAKVSSIYKIVPMPNNRFRLDVHNDNHTN